MKSKFGFLCSGYTASKSSARLKEKHQKVFGFLYLVVVSSYKGATTTSKITSQQIIGEMSEVLGDFIAECSDASSEPISAKVESKEDAKSPKEDQCELLIGGCVDWENMTTKNCQGLDNLHRLIFPAKIRKVFSSSSAMHFFVVLDDGSLYAMGRNDCGQLGTANSSGCDTPTKVTVGFAHEIIKIACGRSHTLILLASGEVYGSGANHNIYILKFAMIFHFYNIRVECFGSTWNG